MLLCRVHLSLGTAVGTAAPTPSCHHTAPSHSHTRTHGPTCLPPWGRHGSTGKHAHTHTHTSVSTTIERPCAGGVPLNPACYKKSEEQSFPPRSILWMRVLHASVTLHLVQRGTSLSLGCATTRGISSSLCTPLHWHHCVYIYIYIYFLFMRMCVCVCVCVA